MAHFFYFELVVRFYFLVKKIDYVNLICVDVDTAWIIHFLRRNKGRMIIDLHEYFEHVPELKGSFLKKMIWNFLSKYSVPKFDICYTVNKSLSEIFSSKYRVDCQFIHNVPEYILPSNKEFTTPLQTVYVGVLNPGRGLEELVACISKRNDVSFCQ